MRSLRGYLRRKLVRSRLAEFVASNATTDRVLDLGCGGSRYAAHFPNRIGVDLRPGRGVAVVADAQRLPLRDGCFGTVLSTEMLEHTTEPQQVIDEIERVLRPGGRALLTTRFLFPIHDAPHDHFRFTEDGLQHLFQRWPQVQVTPETRTFETLAVLLQRTSFQSDLRGGALAHGLLLLTARLLPLADRLVVRQYGDYARSRAHPAPMTSGYHVVAAKGGDGVA